MCQPFQRPVKYSTQSLQQTRFHRWGVVGLFLLWTVSASRLGSETDGLPSCAER